MMGRLRPELGSGVRSFVVENYVIYYRHEDDVLIARVLHGRRDQAAPGLNERLAPLLPGQDSLARAVTRS